MEPPDDELFAGLRAMRSRYPNWRFGQLICNLAVWARGAEASAVWDITDSELLDSALQHLEQAAIGRAPNDENVPPHERQ